MVHANDHCQRFIFQCLEGEVLSAVHVPNATDYHVNHAFSQQLKEPVTGVQRDADREQRVGFFQRDDGLRQKGGRGAMMLPTETLPALPSFSSASFRFMDSKEPRTPEK